MEKKKKKEDAQAIENIDAFRGEINKKQAENTELETYKNILLAFVNDGSLVIQNE
jgi:hypothetical protein